LSSISTNKVLEIHHFVFNDNAIILSGTHSSFDHNFILQGKNQSSDNLVLSELWAVDIYSATA